MKNTQIDPKQVTDYKPLVSDQLLHYSQEILVMEYVYGEPFPGLLYEHKEQSVLPSGSIGPHGVIHSMRDGYIMAFSGQKLQMRMYGQDLACFGRIPQGFLEVKK